jgi:hypothetical protein
MKQGLIQFLLGRQKYKKTLILILQQLFEHQLDLNFLQFQGGFLDL